VERRSGVKVLAGLCAIVVAILAVPAVAAAAPLSIAVVGNHFVNGAGQTIRLLGVDRTSSEYGCVDGFGYDDGHFDAADAAAIAAWNANAVRVPLNEDCWLGLNGQPNSEQGAEPPLTVAGYRQEIEHYVAELNAHGLYAILDLHWSAPGAQVALEQQPMPDLDHSPAFWSSVAGAFKGVPGVVFDVFNEPYDPTDPRSGDDLNPEDKVTWDCWETGTENGPAGGAPCQTSAYDEAGKPTSRYTVAGMQSLVDVIRAAGAAQPVMVGGLNYSNDLSQWVDHAPDDPLNQEAASFHNYMGQACDNVACWDGQIAPVAANVPVVTGEFAEDDFENPTCGNKTPNAFDEEYMDWADQHGVSYLAWAWIAPTPTEIASEGCSAYYLIKDYGYTPASPNGTALRTHLLGLPPGGVTPPVTTPGSNEPPSTNSAPPAGSSSTPPSSSGAGGGGSAKGGPTCALTRFHARVEPGGAAVAIELRASEDCKGTLSAVTAKSFASHGSPKRRRVMLGSVSVDLRAGKAKTVVLKLSGAARALLAAQGSLAADFALKVSGQGAKGGIDRTATLKEPAPRHGSAGG
jgi:hypothetical protein